jgi:aspartyl-tRNA(Asn)/glutamyl-tRNA(Gln) amidotransferase subunit C
MQLDQHLISRLEKLARLQLADAEREQLSADLQQILNMVDKLQNLDTSGVEPLVYVNEEANVLREDIEKQGFTTREALLNAPMHDDRFFKVPKVIGA